MCDTSTQVQPETRAAAVQRVEDRGAFAQQHPLPPAPIRFYVNNGVREYNDRRDFSCVLTLPTPTRGSDLQLALQQHMRRPGRRLRVRQYRSQAAADGRAMVRCYLLPGMEEVFVDAAGRRFERKEVEDRQRCPVADADVPLLVADTDLENYLLVLPE